MKIVCSLVFVLSLVFCVTVLGASLNCDFSGDGFADIAIGAEGEPVNSLSNAGGVTVLYGSANALTATNNQFWTKDSPGILGNAAQDERFGAALACGDFDGNGFVDLAIGAPFAGVRGDDGAGNVHTLYGSASGLTATGNQVWNQDSSGVLETPEFAEMFGESLASGDFNGDGFEDLAIGVHEKVGSVTGAGAVHILFGSSIGLTATGNELWTQNTPGIPSSPHNGDYFGRSLAVGDFGRDTATGCYDDLAIGVFGETINGKTFAGAVHNLFGSERG
jgi:FG-GAP repeat